MIRIDCHFHPNRLRVSNLLGKVRVKRMWKKFHSEKIDAVLVCEHNYKGAKRGFEWLEQHRPKWAKTMLIPGIEVCTERGIDVIVFSRDKYVFSIDKLMTPYAITIEEIIELVENDPKLYGVVTHPYNMSATALMSHMDEEFMKEMVKRLGFLEKHNAALLPVRRAAEFLRLHKVFPKAYERLKKMDYVPDVFHDNEIVIFAGSDAHFAGDIGSCIEIDASPTEKYDEVFDILISPEFKRSVFFKERPSFSYIMTNGFNTVFEGVERRIKRILKKKS